MPSAEEGDELDIGVPERGQRGVTRSSKGRGVLLFQRADEEIRDAAIAENEQHRKTEKAEDPAGIFTSAPKKNDSCDEQE